MRNIFVKTKDNILNITTISDICLSGKKISFNYSKNATNVFESEEEALEAFNKIASNIKAITELDLIEL